jgi:hypothetical protein
MNGAVTRSIWQLCSGRVARTRHLSDGGAQLYNDPVLAALVDEMRAYILEEQGEVLH